VSVKQMLTIHLPKYRLSSNRSRDCIVVHGFDQVCKTTYRRWLLGDSYSLHF